VVSMIDRTFFLWAVVGLMAPFAAGYVLGGTLVAGLTALLWGGAVRVFLVHHVTYSVNSVCHVFGRRRFPTTDESRNVFWLALPTMGEAWHNNHHAFPASARLGLNDGETEALAQLIRSLPAKGITVLLVEHNMDLMMSVADRIVVLNYGLKIAEGSTEEITSNPDVIRAYLGEDAIP